MRRTRRSGTRFAAPISQRRSELRTTHRPRSSASMKVFRVLSISVHSHPLRRVQRCGCPGRRFGLRHRLSAHCRSRSPLLRARHGAGPVWMANHRLQQAGLPGRAAYWPPTLPIKPSTSSLLSAACTTPVTCRAPSSNATGSCDREAGWLSWSTRIGDTTWPGGKPYGTPFGSCWAISASWRHEPTALTMPMLPEKPPPRRRISTRASRLRAADPGASS
jgi:hypothetical protein